MRILVTGGAGFIGSNFVHHIIKQHTDYEVLVIDKLTYAGNLANLDLVLANNRVRFIRLDICDPALVEVVRGCDLVVNFADETHADRSKDNARAFVRSNVEGTWQLLETCRKVGVRRFLQVSTHEVYGNLGTNGKFREDAPLAPNTPYGAAKAAADQMVLAYVATYGCPAIITRCCSNYGPYQFPDKFIPLMILQALAGEFLPIYGDGQNVRDWIHVLDHCRALDSVLHGGREGEVYNIGGECELRKIDVASRVLTLLDKPLSLVRSVNDRFGHDRSFAVDCSKLKEELNWAPTRAFDSSLADTIQWYQDHGEWLEQIRTGEYLEYFDRNYHGRETHLRQMNYR